MKNFGIYASRAVSAFCLFVILVQANVWLNTLDNTILVLGYRLFILSTPFFYLFLKHRLTFFAFLCAEIGLFCWLLHLYFIGTIFIALGLAVSGYMLKYYSVFTVKGAASNKIALNVGSMLSGLAIVMTQNRHLLIVLCIICLFFSSLSFYQYYIKHRVKSFQSNARHFSLKNIFSLKGVAWIIVGYAIGVKLIAIVSILPQFLLADSQQHLPHWYGLMLTLNCLIVVVFQLPIINYISRMGKFVAILPLIFGMLIVMLSHFFCLTNFWGAILWTLLLSFIECTISYLDKLSQDEGCLLLKESAVGFGSAITVYLVRDFSPSLGSLFVGSVSLLLLFVALVLFFIDSQKNSF